MEPNKQNFAMLDLMHRAAFAVANGVIVYINPAARCYLLQTGMEVTSLLAAGKEEYASFSDGCLHLTVEIEGYPLGATVVRSDEYDIFVLESGVDTARLQVLALAASELRQPLTGAIAMTNRLQPSATDAQRDQFAQLNRRMMQLQRILSNMSDCTAFDQPNARTMEYLEIGSFLEEILEKTAQALQSTGLSLSYQLPTERIYTLGNPQKLERAVYNMLSNAAKFSPTDGAIHAQLSRNGNRLAFSVTDQGQGIQNSGDVFTRYLREPGLEDPRFGVGLGMVLIRGAAAIHGGAVLIDHPQGVGSRVTMTLAITHKHQAEMRSPVFRVDYAGDRDHCLLELSDVLPASMYQTE